MKKIFTLVFTSISITVFCQVGGVAISAAGNPPDPSAMLDVSASNKGFLMPRISKSQRDAIANPALGLQIYDTTTNCIEVYGLGSWQSVSCLCSGAPSTPGSIAGNSNPCANASNITYSTGLILGANTYTWTVPADATIIAGQGTNSITVDFGSSPGNVTVSANNSCGTSSPGVLPVTINAIPSAPGSITGNQYPCANSSAQPFSVAPVSGATSYTWTVPSGSSVTAGQGTTSILVNFYSTPGDISVTASNICGTGSAASLPITMATPPSNPGDITGPGTFNINQSGVVYTVAPVTEATTYTWTVPHDATITSGQGTDSINVTFGSGSGQICVTAGNCAGTSSANSCLSVYNPCYSSSSQTFSFTGGQQTFTVPCGVGSITIAAYGAQGGSQYGNGAQGGLAMGTIAVTPGQTFYVYVGGQNGYNGGGAGGGGCNGGGMSDVRSGGTAFSNWIIVAGGGGGGSSNNSSSEQNTTTGTGGGGVQCANGAGGGGGGYYAGYSYSSAGGPGTCTSGGASGTSYGGWAGGGGGGGLTSGGDGGVTGGYGNPGSAGTQGQGGDYGYNSSCGSQSVGSGGGGGYYGGGGTASGQCAGGSGGGGSSWASATLTNTSFTGGVQSGNGKVVINW